MINPVQRKLEWGQIRSFFCFSTIDDLDIGLVDLGSYKIENKQIDKKEPSNHSKKRTPWGFVSYNFEKCYVRNHKLDTHVKCFGHCGKFINLVTIQQMGI